MRKSTTKGRAYLYNRCPKKWVPCIKVQNKKGELEDFWTGDYIFENEWQDFRTKKKRDLELETPLIEVKKGKRKIAIKVVDIFGNDTMKIIEITV